MHLSLIRLLTFIALFLSVNLSAQQLVLKAKGISARQTQIIDSLGYNPKHADVKSIQTEVSRLSDQLIRNGFLANQLLSSQQLNDTIFQYTFDLHNKTNHILLYIDPSLAVQKLAFPDAKSNKILSNPLQIETLLSSGLAQLERNGYSLAKISLTDLNHSADTLIAKLQIDPGRQRQLNDIVINGYDKFPKGHRKNLLRRFKNRTFSNETLLEIESEFKKLRFVNQTRNPEILFKSDTTKVYMYLEKAKPNRFEGFVGFANDDSEKLTFSGYVDLTLVNFLNAGEDLTIYWKSDGQDQKTFNAELQLPFIFSTPLALRGKINIFKQDSTFQNTRTELGLGYFASYNSRFYLNYETTESSDIQNQDQSQLSDFDNHFVSAQFQYDNAWTHPIFREKSAIDIKIGLGKRTSKIEDQNQQFVQANLMHTFELNSRNQINLRSQNYMLNSDRFLISELHRFGGINSVRGFTENSLQANMLTSLLTEYRFIPTNGLYIHSILDLGYYADETQQQSELQSSKLFGFGFGIGLLTRNGLLNLIYANGSTDEQAIRTANSIVQISFKSTF